jgi:hypothetical protein
MIGGRNGWGGRFDIGFARATLQAGVLISQLLDFGAQRLIFRDQRLNEVEQLLNRLPSGWICDGIKVDVRNLHTGNTMRARHWI